MIWVALLTVAVFMAAAVHRDRRACVALVACAVGILLMQFLKAALPNDLKWIGASALWVSIGFFIITRLGRRLSVTGALLILSGLSYFPGRLLGDAFHTGNPLLIAADALGIIAMLSAGYSGVTFIRNRGLVGSNSDSSGWAFVGDCDYNSQEKGGEKIGRGHV